METDISLHVHKTTPLAPLLNQIQPAIMLMLQNLKCFDSSSQHVHKVITVYVPPLLCKFVIS